MNRRKNDVSIIPHTEKSFIVTSNNHIAYMITLKNLGGVFDATLIDKETGKKFMGWIFFMDKKEKILNWIESGCPNVYKVIEQSESKLDSEQINQTSILKDLEKRIQSSIDIIFLKLDCFEVQIKRNTEEINIIKSMLEQKVKSEAEEEYEILE
jgi:hypothetical protein